MSNEEEEQQLQEQALAAVITSSTVVAMMMGTADNCNGSFLPPKPDHRLLPRSRRKEYRHGEALHCINRDFLGTNPLYGAEFIWYFRISRSRFQRLMEDVGNSGDAFYLKIYDARGKPGMSMEARLLLPLKTLAYGVAAHCFCPYFQASFTQARACMGNFYRIIQQLYEEEYFRTPTTADLKSLQALHKSKHGVEGLIGSLDCMHTHWNKCPVAWHGSFQGKEGHPTIVLEGVADYNLFFWYASYGYAGTLNDINIMRLSPLFDQFLDGSFESIERGVVPYQVSGDGFHRMYLLVDGIYPRMSRFVKGIKQPIGDQQRKYSKWQEAARKDIERAFGVLQIRWKAIARPIEIRDLDTIGAMVRCVLILHNICVSDRVMGSVSTRYNPALGITLSQGTPEDIKDSSEYKTKYATVTSATVAIRNADPAVQRLLRRKERFQQLTDLEEYNRLHQALLDMFE